MSEKFQKGHPDILMEHYEKPECQEVCEQPSIAQLKISLGENALELATLDFSISSLLIVKFQSTFLLRCKNHDASVDDDVYSVKNMLGLRY